MLGVAGDESLAVRAEDDAVDDVGPGVAMAKGYSLRTTLGVPEFHDVFCADCDGLSVWAEGCNGNTRALVLLLRTEAPGRRDGIPERPASIIGLTPPRLPGRRAMSHPPQG
jgi:hypothetical protein